VGRGGEGRGRGGGGAGGWAVEGEGWGREYRNSETSLTDFITLQQPL